jgi:hypothetical protein
MKIWLLMLLIGSLRIAIQLTGSTSSADTESGGPDRH